MIPGCLRNPSGTLQARLEGLILGLGFVESCVVGGMVDGLG